MWLLLAVQVWAAPRVQLPASAVTARAEVFAAKGIRVPAPVERINAVLKDFPAEKLEKLPKERLAALADVVMDGGGTKGLSLLAEARAGIIDDLRGRGEEKLLNPGHTETHPDLVEHSGAPESARRVSESRIYRHYTTEEGLKNILATKSLWNGYMPYVALAPGVWRKTYRPVTGVFLTLPGVSGDEVGVPAKSDYEYYVDVRVPKAMPILEVEKGAIYLIPLPARARSWLAEQYRRWAKGEVARDAAAEKMDAEGGPGPDLQVPVTIVGQGRAR